MAAQKTRVRITNTTTTEQTVTERDGQITAFEVTDLQPYTTYSAEAAVMVNGNWLAYTQPSTFTTLPLSQSSYLVSYDHDHAYYSLYNATNAYTAPTSASGYATFGLVRGEGAITYMYWNFGLSIPENATILSVSCRFRSLCETTISARIPIHTGQLYAGTTTPKGTAKTIPNTATTLVFDIDPSEWTPAELNNAKLKIYAERGTENVNTSYTFRLYGAEMVVEYY